MKLSLSILNCNLAKLNEELEPIYEDLDYIHMDVMDGNFVPNISFGQDLIKSLRPYTSLPFDTHLMINNPMQYIESFVKAGSNYVTFHYEAVDNPDEVIDYIHSLNAKAGISIKPNTSVEVLKPYLAKLDLILIMSVEPGFGGQKFMDSSIAKLKYLAELRPHYNYLISVDGGINDKTIGLVAPYTDLVVSGSYISKAEDKKKNIEVIHKA